MKNCRSMTSSIFGIIIYKLGEVIVSNKQLVQNQSSDQQTQLVITPSKNRVATWKSKIEFLLEDPAGIRIFYVNLF